MNRLAILGGGSWGTALAMALASRFESVRLWVHEPALAARIQATRQNDVFLPGFALPESVRAVGDPAEALEQADIVLSVVPSHYVRPVMTAIAPHLPASAILVSASKGLETGTLLRVSEVIEDVISPAAFAVLSGPSFAREVAGGKPVALVCASAEPDCAETVQRRFSTAAMRIYGSTDVLGVELGGALKNVIAVAAGVCTGLDLGHNALAALMTRGLAEITRLALAMGAQERTLAGLAGMGDLVLTCTGDLSRNRLVGKRLAAGEQLQQILASMRMVAEGVRTTDAAVELAARAGVEMPIAEQMQAVLRGERDPATAIRQLMERSLKGE